MHIYEYLFAALIIVLVLVASTVMVATISTPTANASDKNQLSITAQKIMTQLMLDPGYPYNWGNTTETPQVFGLAKYGETSRQAYELDPDKVMRLNSSIEGNVPAATALKLLSLTNDQGAAEYGFTLQFRDTIQVSVQSEQAGTGNYIITATSDYALPIVGAKISATLYYIEDTKVQHTSIVHGVTAYNGSYTALFSAPPQTAKVLAVTVDYYGAQESKFYQVTSGPSATLFQSKLIPTADQPYDIGILGDPHEIILVDNGNGLETSDLPIEVNETSNSLTLGTPLEPSAVAVIAVSGDNLLLANRDFSNINYQTINFQDPTVHSAAFSYSLERTVTIAGSTYTATLYFWRMST